METYSYKAVSADGKDKKGTLQAETREEALKKVKDMGMIPVSVEAQNALNKDIELPFMTAKKVSSRDMSVFCRQFASILKAGVSIINALEMMESQTENKDLKKSIGKVRGSVEKGETLSDAMRMESLFPSILVDMVRAGEASGSLETSLSRMAIQFEKDAKTKGMIKKAMIYPMVLLCVAIGVLVVMVVYVIPKFVSMFEDLGSDLPFMTKMMLNLSDFVINYWYIIIIAIVAIVFLYKSYKKTDGGKHVIDGIKLKIPVFGKLTKKTACARFARTMSTLLQAGMPMIEALDIVSSTMDNVLYKDALQNVKNGVSLGMPLSEQLRKTNLFPPMILHMTGIGEETGNLEEMLTNTAVYYEEEVELATQSITALMEPLIILVMAAIVIVLVLSIYQPMIQLYNTL